MKIFHLNNASGNWDEIPWEDWMAFRSYGADFQRLKNVPAGEQCFVVAPCEDGMVFNIIPHKYTLNDAGKIIATGFDKLTKSEREEFHRLELLIAPSLEEEERLRGLREKVWPHFLPPKNTVGALLRALPGMPDMDSKKPAMQFLAAMGIVVKESGRQN